MGCLASALTLLGNPQGPPQLVPIARLLDLSFLLPPPPSLPRLCCSSPLRPPLVHPFAVHRLAPAVLLGRLHRAVASWKSVCSCTGRILSAAATPGDCGSTMDSPRAYGTA